MNNNICKLLEQQDLELMVNFVDDENTKYSLDDLEKFISEKNAYGFIARSSDSVVAFAFGYVLVHPDGKKVFYLDAIDVAKDYQSKGIGTDLMLFIRDYAKRFGCHEMFLVTNKSNISACRCYEKSGAKSATNPYIV